MMMRRTRSRAGNAAIEFCLVFLLLFALLSGAFRLGYSMFIYESLSTAMAGAARFAARSDFDSPNHSFAARVKNVSVYGSPLGGGAALVPGLQTSDITVTWTTDDSGVPSSITVGIGTFSVNAIFQTFTWTGKPSATVRFAGRYIT